VLESHQKFYMGRETTGTAEDFLANALGTGGGAGRGKKDTHGSSAAPTNMAAGTSIMDKYRAHGSAGAAAASTSVDDESDYAPAPGTTSMPSSVTKNLFKNRGGTNRAPFSNGESCARPSTPIIPSHTPLTPLSHTSFSNAAPEEEVELTLSDLTGNSGAGGVSAAGAAMSADSTYRAVADARRRNRASAHGTSLAPALNSLEEAEFNTKVWTVVFQLPLS